MKKKTNTKLLLVVLLFGAGCGTNNSNERNNKSIMAEKTMVVIYTPKKDFLDSLSKDDQDINESYSDCVYDIQEIVKYSESIELEVITTNNSDTIINGVQIDFGINNLCSVALLNHNSLSIIRTPTIEDFKIKYNSVLDK